MCPVSCPQCDTLLVLGWPVCQKGGKLTSHQSVHLWLWQWVSTYGNQRMALRIWGHEQRELLRAGSNLRHLAGKKPAQLKVITCWTRYFGRPRMVHLHFIHLKEYYIFNLFPSPPTQKKTITTKKPCKKNPQKTNSTRKEIQTWARPSQSWKHER